VGILLLLPLGLGIYWAVGQWNAWSHLRAARYSVERYQSQQALIHTHACLRVWPRDPEVLLLAARTTRRLGDFDKADAYLKQCAASGKLAEEAELEAVLLRVARGDGEGVEPYCRALIDQGHPATSLLFEALVHGHMQGYRLRAASAYLEVWRKRHPDNPQALVFEGIMHSQLQDHRSAATAYRRALEVEPDLHEARLYLADALLEAHEAYKALTHLEYVCLRVPGHTAAQVRLAACLAQVNRQREAEQVLDDLIARDPSYAPALFERGQLAARAGQLDRAERLLRTACSLRPGDYQAHYQLYLCLGQGGKADEAGEVLKRLEQLKEDHARIREIVTAQMQRAPRDPNLQQELGSLLLRTGGVEEGLRWFRRALSIDPDHAPTHRALAEFFERVGDLGRAAQHRALAGPAGAASHPAPGSGP
jgi:tetratricopeptide (TPR) repeat protein